MPRKKSKVVLSIVAHPDDVEFGCGATMAKFSSEGHKLYFVICTAGNRGSRHHKRGVDELVEMRKEEQRNAAKILGAEDVIFLNYPDGELTPDIKFKEDIVKLLRRYKPDMVFTHDPSWIYRTGQDSGFVNHNDHRACGTAVIDACYPLARDLTSFPNHQKEGLEPHKAKEIYMFNFYSPNYFVDVTGFIDKKIDSIKAHVSQIDDPKWVEEWVTERATKLGRRAKVKFAEGFTKLVLR